MVPITVGVVVVAATGAFDGFDAAAGGTVVAITGKLVGDSVEVSLTGALEVTETIGIELGDIVVPSPIDEEVKSELVGATYVNKYNYLMVETIEPNSRELSMENRSNLHFCTLVQNSIGWYCCMACSLPHMKK